MTAVRERNESAWLLPNDGSRTNHRLRGEMRRFDDNDPVDLVVVGCGAGGSTLLQRLARQGWRVVGLDAGPFWDPDADWVSDEAGSHHLYWTEPRVIGGTDPVPLGSNNSGRGVGGSMVHYAGYTPRFHPSDFATWTTYGIRRPTAVPRLFIAPSTMDLLGVELEISGHADRSFKLKQALRKLFDDKSAEAPITYVLIDCPPSLNLLTLNGLAAADAVVVPLQCEFFALEGLSQLLTTVDQVRRSLNPSLSIHGIVLTMFDPRNNLAAQVVADVRSFMGEKVYETIIPRNVRVSEAPSYGKPVLLYDLKCTGSQAYLKLASEVIKREARWRAA